MNLGGRELMAEETGDDDLCYVRGVGTPAAYTHLTQKKIDFERIL